MKRVLEAASVMFLVLPHSEASAQWETTEWKVDQSSGIARSDMLPGLEDQLSKSSAWFEGLRFDQPELFVSGRVAAREYFPAHFNPGLGDASSNIGAYYSSDEKKLYFGTKWFQRDGKTYKWSDLGDGLVDLDEGYLLSAVHEVFHGVQYAYNAEWPDALDWVTEGTAEAARYAWAEKMFGAVQLHRHFYDYPLNEPFRGTGSGNTENYTTGHFWYHLGGEIGATDRIGYLRSVFSEFRTQGTGPGHDGLTTVARALEQFGGLYELYPRFIAGHANDEKFFRIARTHVLKLPQEIVDREAMVRALKPLTTNAYKVRASVPRGRTAVLRIAFEEDAYYEEHGEDLHLIVDDRRYDQPANADVRRNIFRRNLPGQAEPYEFLVRVANVPPDPSDPDELQERSYTLKLSLGEVEPCDPDVMIAATASAPMGASPVAIDPEEPGLHPGSGGSLSFSGLVSDAGSACTHHVSAVDFMGAMMSGDVSEAERRDLAGTMMARAQAMQKRLEQSDMQKYASMSEEEIEKLPEEEKRKIIAMAMGARDLLRAPKDMAEVVINVYSPHIQTWQFGLLGFPQKTGHGGVGGWSANAAANLVIRLPDVSPSEIKEGETYQAAALGLAVGGEAPAQGSLASVGGFYTSWDGEWREVPGSGPSPADIASCEQSNNALEQLMQQLPAAGAVPPPQSDCSAGGLAFNGSLQALSGDLTGTVTIDAITGAGVRGTFELSGMGTLYVEESRFTYNDGRLIGDQQTSREQRGPITIRGAFSAPNHIEGVPRVGGYTSVVIQ